MGSALKGLQQKGLITGIFFGTGSGVITTLGLIVGLFAGTDSLTAVLGGIVIIAISDSLSDAFGIHLSEEARADSTTRTVWLATLATFITKFSMAMTFVVPLLLLPLREAVIASLLWGALVMVLLSVFIARRQGQKPLLIILEHLGIAVVVVVLSWLVGTGISRMIG